jgi:hypothetical protein
MRLEIRGDAVFGYIDGKPAFGAPIQIPEGMNLGWWGMAPWAPQFGVAQAVVREVAGGPLPMHIGVFDPKSGPWTDEAIVEKLKPSTSAFTVVSPAWFFQDITGEVRPGMDLDFPRTRLLSRYYKIRLYPMILAASPRTLKIDELVSLAKSAKVDGFTLSFTRMPPEEWFEIAESQLVGTGVGMMAISIDEVNGVAEVREMGSAPSLLAGPRLTREFEVVELNEQEKPVVVMHEPPPPVLAGTPEDAEPPTGEASEETGADAVVEEVPVRRKPSVVSSPVQSRVYLF